MLCKNHSEQWNKYLVFIFSAYAVFIAGFYYVPNAVDLYKYYSVVVLIPGLLLIPMGFRLLRDNTFFLLLLAYLTYMLITPVWGETFDLKAYLNYIRLALYILMFFVITAVLYTRYPTQFNQLLQALCVLAAVSAVISIWVWYGDHPFPQSRLVGIGPLDNPNGNGQIYGFFAIFSLGFSLGAKSWRLRSGFLALMLVLLVFLWLTQSRGPMVGVLVATIALVILERPARLFSILFLVLITFAVLGMFFPDMVTSAIKRGASSRPEIWGIVLTNMAESPLFGLGYLTEEFLYFPRLDTYLYAHNAYLGALRDGGVMGLGLLLAMLGYAVWQSVRTGKTMGHYVYLALIVYGMTCIFVDADRLITRPRELWIILWFPLSLIMSHGILVGNGINVTGRDSPTDDRDGSFAALKSESK